jgi:hypothetical protein
VPRPRLSKPLQGFGQRLFRPVDDPQAFSSSNLHGAQRRDVRGKVRTLADILRSNSHRQRPRLRWELIKLRRASQIAEVRLLPVWRRWCTSDSTGMPFTIHIESRPADRAAWPASRGMLRPRYFCWSDSSGILRL